MRKKKINSDLKVISCFICSVMLVIAAVCGYYKMHNSKVFETSVYTFAAATPKSNEFMYLTDIDYIASQSKSAWGSILKDITSAGALISVKVEGAYYSFEKGLWAHATSTVVYDISSYDYNYFTAYAGLNATAASSSNGVLFSVYTSVDGTNWDTKVENVLKKAGEEAALLQVDIKGANYLKLIANDNGSNGNDHAVYAEPKLTNSLNADNVVQSVSYYDELIKEKNATVGIDNSELELLLLQREFVNNVGQFALRRYVDEDPANEETLNWLFNDLENLREFILGGAPEGGSYYNALTVLSRLYKNYKSDLDNHTLLNNRWDPTLTYSDLSRRMMFSIALTHSQLVGLWMQSSVAVNQSDPVRRYAIFRYLHDNGKFVATPSIDLTDWFEYLSVEEMRFVLNNNIDDEEILWLNAYVQSKIDANPSSASSLLTPHSYIAYVWPNYQNAVYYDDANYDYFNELFAIPDENDSSKMIGMWDASFTIPGGTEVPEYTLTITRGTSSNKIYKVWMNFRNKFGTGAVCGGISKSGANIRGTHGIPATVIGQPGHAAILYYTKNGEGKGYWAIDNDVSGWTYSEKGERMLIGWGNATYQRGYSVVYMVLAQEALNDFANFQKAEETIMLAKAYAGDLSKQEELYREALRIQPINIDAWYGLIQTFNADDSKTEADYYTLVAELSEKLMAFPLPMTHLANLIQPKLTSPEYVFQFTLLQTKTLTEASVLPNTATDIVLQPSVTRTEGNFLLGKLDKTLATFSFDGEDAGKIALSSRFDGSGVRWDYSLDGGETWKEVSFTGEEEHKIQLTDEEIASINENDDISIHIVGVNYSDENIYKIDITKPEVSSLLYANDLENRVVGIDLTYEWRNNENDEWTSYAVASPNNTGDKTLYVRRGATGTYLASEPVAYTFTADNQPETRKYIPVSHLNIEAVSTEAVSNGGSAIYAIDGNYNTRWHSAWNGTDTERYITIRLDRAVYLSAVEFVPAGGGNGRINDGTIWGSMDGENWVKLAEKTGITYPAQANTNEQAQLYTQSFEIENPIEVKYVKIVADRTNGNWFTARAFNLFQDATEDTSPTAGVGYSTTSPTQDEVVARLINVSTDNYEILSEGGDTHVFTENGTFEFEFKDLDNNEVGKALAKVDWIDREAPEASVSYDKDSKTNEEVTATLTNLNESIYVLDEHDNTTGFIRVVNGVIKSITYYNELGDISKIVYVESLTRSASTDYYNMRTTSIEYYNEGKKVYKTTLDEMGNIAEETFYDNEGNEIDPTNKEEYRKYNQVGRTNPLEYTFTSNGTYVFKIKDEAGNVSNIMAIVNNIDTVAPMAAITYDITTSTDKNVIATLTDATEKITITNNNGNDTYTFTKNGEFTFEFVDEAGNTGTATAKVDWINNTDDEDNSDDNNNNDNNDNNDNNNNDNNNNDNDNSDDNNDNSNDNIGDDNNNDNSNDNNNQDSNNNQTNKPSQPSNGSNSNETNNNDIEFTNPKTYDYFPMYGGMIIFGIVVLAYITKKLI